MPKMKFDDLIDEVRRLKKGDSLTFTLPKGIKSTELGGLIFSLAIETDSNLECNRKGDQVTITKI